MFLRMVGLNLESQISVIDEYSFYNYRCPSINTLGKVIVLKSIIKYI